MSRLNILVVEDDPVNILVAEKLLERYFNIHIAKSAEAAIDSVTKNYFDVILIIDVVKANILIVYRNYKSI